jgi:hypothetical protein
MPHASMKLVGGVNSNETPALNENSGISQSNLIRFFYDPNGISLAQKLGGWTKFFPSPMAATVRALWAWEDLNLNAHLAFGTQTITGSASAQLGVITDGALQAITPTALTDNVLPVVTTVAGDPSVQITDTTVPGITSYNSVYIATQISVGGIILFGLYQCDPDGFLSADAYTVYSIDQLGNLLPPTSNSSSPVLPSFTTVGPSGPGLGSITVTVTLPNYTYAAGDTFPVLVPTVVGGITFFGNYIVQMLIDANNFTILANTPATSSATGVLNGGLVRFIYNFGQGALPGGTGYGIGTYGGGGYGTGTPVAPAVGPAIDAIDWTLDNWGQVLIACADRVPATNGTPYQPIYQWDPSAASATIITAAPPVNDGIFVAMPQRQIVAWGSTETGIQDPLLINWCDVGNYNQWIALVTNQAGSYRIPKGSHIVGAAQGPQQAIIWTDIDCWSMQYIGPPYVYSFNEIGTGCGLIGRKAAASVNGIYYWMGPSQFYSLSSNGVQPIPCSVWDVVYQNLNTGLDPVSGVSNLQKIRVAVNSRFGEIQWFYPSANGSGEVDSYVKYNVYLNLWDYGSLGRTAWVDQSVLGPPIGADPASLYLYQHETSNDADGQAMNSSFQTGYYAISEGDYKSFIDWIWPDMKWGQYSQTQSATVQISFLVADYPGDTPTVYGPYSVTQATEYFYTRFRARLVAVKIASNDLGSFWRIGNIRYRFAPDGKI